jgi:hypothetical protein
MGKVSCVLNDRVFQIMLLLFAATSAHAQPTTTIITHGFTIGDKGAWVQDMASKIVQKVGHGGVYRYNPSTGEWDFVQILNQGQMDNMVLIFNWTDESDANPLIDHNWRYAEAAADALYAALRDPVYNGPAGPGNLLTNRTVHFIGHSRGCSVNSEAARRLRFTGFPIDQITTLDPHPVNPNTGMCDWGDPVPQKWAGVSWADNYHRQGGVPRLSCVVASAFCLETSGQSFPASVRRIPASTLCISSSAQLSPTDSECNPRSERLHF